MNRDSLRLNLLVLIFSFLTAAGSDLFGQDPFFMVLPLGDEIRNGSLQTMIQDQEGFLLLGTSSGIYHFDGVRLMIIPSDDSLVNASFNFVFQAADGTIWAGTGTGKIAKLHKGIMEYFPLNGGPVHSKITSIAEDSGHNFWFSTYGEGVFCLSGNKLYRFSAEDGLGDNYTYTMATDPKGNVWVGSDGGISICSLIAGKKSITTLTSTSGLPDNIVLKIIHDGNGMMWIGMHDGGVCKIDAGTRNVEPSVFRGKWNYGPVNDLLVIGDRLWAASHNHGIISADLKSGIIQCYKNVNGTDNSKISRIIPDSEGNLWFLTSHALIRSPGAKLEFLSPENNVNFSNIHSILCDSKGDVWFSNDKGLFLYRRGVPKQKNPEQFLSLTNNPVVNIISLYEDRDGYIWIGTFGKGLLRLNPGTGAISRYSSLNGLGNDNILSIMGVKDEVWLATLGGAFRCRLPAKGSLKKTKLVFEEFSETKGLGNNYIYSVFADSKKRVWFATDGKGITVMENGRFINYTDIPGLKSKVVYSITEDLKGNIWFSTSNAGLYEFDGHTFRNFSAQEGLSNISITSLATTGKSEILIIHNIGIDIYNTLTGKFSYLGPETGVGEISPDLNTLAADRSRGIFWIGTAKGIIKLNADAWSSIEQPIIRLNSVRLFLSKTDTMDRHVFRYDRNHLTFDFVGLWYRAPEKVSYQVRLIGYDLDWISTRNTTVTYSNLMPGKYTFQVRASLNNDFTDSPVASYKFTIQKPFWKTLWFLGLVILIAISFVYLYFKQREKKVRKEEALHKEKILFQFETLKSQVNPHFLFNSFSTLSAIIDTDKEMALDYVQKLSVFFRTLLEYRDKNVITLREEIAQVDNYYYLQKKRYGENFNLRIDIPGEYLSTYIPPLTLQMFIENAIKHNIISADMPLLVKIFIENNSLVITNPYQPKKNVTDSTGVGIKNIRARYLLLIHRDIEIRSSSETYTIILPIIKDVPNEHINH